MGYAIQDLIRPLKKHHMMEDMYTNWTDSIMKDISATTTATGSSGGTFTESQLNAMYQNVFSSGASMATWDFPMKSPPVKKKKKDVSGLKRLLEAEYGIGGAEEEAL